MNKKNHTRSALFTSIISLLLCVSMLVGTTFAWFTDNVTSANNIIKSGNLDVTLEYWDGNSWEDVEDASDILAGNLWEPGYVDVAYLRLKNAGSLALKYQLGVNIVSETEGKNQNEETFKLSDYIYFDVVEGVNGETGAYANRAAALAVATENTKISTGYSKAGALEAGSGYVYLAMVVHMPTTVGNVANHNGKNVPQIDLGINVFATQFTSESDSFDENYDGGAKWIDDASIGWYMEGLETGEYVIGSAEDLAGLAAIVNGTATSETATYSARATTIQDDFAGKTITLASNIDLAGKAWTPIGNWDCTFGGNFDGQGYTINNLYINAPEGEGVGLFGVVQNATIKDINVKNVKIFGYSMVAGIVGAAYPANISDCKITGKVEIGADWAYVAGVAGYCNYGTQVDGCSVIAEGTGLIQSNTRNAVGGITAWLLEGDHKVTDCHVKNLNLVGWTNVGGITGFVHYNNTIDGCSVENVKLTKTRMDGNPGLGLIAGGWSYHASNAITLRNNTVKNATMEGNHVAYAAYNELYGSEYNGATTTNFVLENNSTENITNNLVEVVKAADNAALKDALQNNATVVVPEGEYTLPSLAGKEGITIIGAADGSTVVGGENASTGFGGNFGKDTTIKNVTFAGSTNGARWTYANGGTSTFENCTFAGDSTYGFHIDESKGATFIFNNCTFSGFNAFAGDLVKVVFNNCTFLNNGNYGHTNIWSVAELNNCTFGDSTSISTQNKLIFDGVEENYHHEFIGSSESLFAFAKSVNEGADKWNGQKIVLVADIDLENAAWTPIGQTGTTQFMGTFDGNGYTISNLNIDSSAQTGAHYSSGLFGWLNKATVKNLTIKDATVTGNHNVGVIAGYMETAGCTISNCHVINATVVAKHANDDACGDKVGVIVGHAGNAGVKVENCSAENCTVTAGRDAGQIVGAALTANVVGCTATNVTVTASSDCTGANINDAIIGRNLG